MSNTVMASVLFTDLVESTALAARLGPEHAEQIRRTHFGLLRGVVTATGGTEVKNLGDGLMVAFTSPSRALACATGMQQAMERHNERAREPLRIRVGFSVGEVVEDDGDFFGDPVVEAARLCAAANGGQILTTELVRALVGRHAPQAFHAIGELTLKGIPEPVSAVEVRWEPEMSEGRVPLPAALVSAARDAPFGFFGRREELDVINEVRKRAFTEPRLQTVVVGGEAGIGKTSVVAQTATRAHASGAVVLLGHCDEDLTVPYQPWIQSLSHLVRHVGRECVDTLSPVHRTALGRLVPSIASREREATGESDRLVLIHAVEMLLKAVSADTPIVLVLEDLHWADAASLHVLRHLVASADATPLLVLCTYRHTDLSQDHPLTALLADFHRQSGITRLQLVGLDESETVDLVTAVAGHALDAGAVGLAQALRRDTDGNPFFTGELLRHLGESGMLHQGSDARWVVEGDLATVPLPASIRDVVARRVARLGPEASRIISLASVIGRDFALEFLATISDRSVDVLLDLLEAATTAALVSEREGTPGLYRFTHALIQRTLYEDLGAARRARTHQRIAEALERAPRDAASGSAELARHWVAATRPADQGKALHYVVQTAEEALRALAPDDAIRWYKQALEPSALRAHPDEVERGRLLVGLGTAQHQVGSAEYRQTLMEAVGIARRVGDSDLLVAAILAADRGIAGTSATDVEWVDATEAALAAVGSADSRARARLLTVLSQSIDAHEWERRRDLITEAVAVARRLGDERALIAILPVAYQHYGPEALDRRLAETAEAIALAARFGDPLAECNALFHRIDACMQAGDIDEVDHRIAELSVLAHSTRLPLHLWQLHMSTSFRALVAGDCEAAEAEAETARDVGTAGGHTEAMLAYGAQLLEIRRHQGRLGEMVGFLVQVERDYAAAIGLRQLLTAVFSEVGRLDEARALLALDVATDFAEVARDTAWLTIMGSCAVAAVALRDKDACRMLYERLLPHARHHAAVYATMSGAIARHLGCMAAVLGHDDAAVAHLEVALELHEHLRAPYWTALTLLDLRDALMQRGAMADHARACELSARASKIARDRGYATLRERGDL